MESSMEATGTRACTRALSYMLDAQATNNLATVYIEQGQYVAAIETLQEALRLWEEHRVRNLYSKSQSMQCTCRHCTLDACILFSERRKNHRSNQNSPINDNNKRVDISRETKSQTSHERGNKRRRLSMHKALSLNDNGNNDDPATLDFEHKNHSFDETSSTNGYTYQTPIRMPRKHNMGSSCFFIIMFNLALATHLKLLNSTVKATKDEIEAALNLYELVFEYWSRLQADSNSERAKNIASNSLRFIMILFNNMSQMYRMVNNSTKQEQCLQNLMSILMVVVEWNSRLAGTRQNNGRNHNHDTFQQSIDGFLTNVMPPSQCAEAA